MAAASSRNVRLAWLLAGCPAVGWFAVLAGISAAIVAFVGAAAYVVYFLLTVPDGFFS